MVLKKSKIGANTGNTLRKAMRYGNPGFIIKTEATRSNFVSSDKRRSVWMDDRDIPSGQVPLSLNKRKMWDLPEELHEQVLEQTTLQHKQPKTEAQEGIESELPKKKQKRQNKHTEKEEAPARIVLEVEPDNWNNRRSSNKRVYPKEMGLNVNLDSHAPENSSINSRLRNQVSTPVDVTYQVYVSTPADVYPYRQVDFNCVKDQRSNKRRGIHRCGRYADVKHALDELDWSDYEDEVEWNEEPEDDSLPTPTQTLCLETFIVEQQPNAQANSFYADALQAAVVNDDEIETVMQSIIESDMGVASINRATCQTVKKYEKGTYTFIERPPITRTSEIAAKNFHKIEERPVQLDNSNNSWFTHTFQMNLKEEEVDPVCLAESYGNGSYMEGQATERAFVIFDTDTKSSFNNLILVQKVVSESSTEVAEEEHNKFNLTVFTKYPTSLQHPTSGGACTSLDQLVKSLFERHKHPSQRRHGNKPFSVVKEFSRHETHAMHFDDVIKTFLREKNMETIRQRLLGSSSSSSSSSLADDINNEHTCRVCFEENTPDQLTKMSACMHSVCKDCWTGYLVQSLSEGSSSQVTCPCCSMELDLVTMLMLMGPNRISLFMAYLNRLCERYIHLRGNMKFCPSPKCNRILVHNNNLLDSNSDSDSDTPMEADRSISSGTVAPSVQSVLVDTPVVPCDCATKWCFQCDSKAHWPASCQAAKEYDEFYAKEVGTLIDEKGDLFKMTVSIKKCPGCKLQAERAWGCNHMTCVHCSKEYCWECLRDWKNHDFNKCASVAVGYTDVTFSSLDAFDMKSGKVRDLQRRAMRIRFEMKNIRKLKTKLRLSSNDGTSSKPEICWRNSGMTTGEYSRLSILRQGYFAVQESYALYEYTLVALTERKGKGGKLRVFSDFLKLSADLLKDTLEANEINMKLAVLYLNGIKKHLHGLVQLGIKT